jgi:hypothetical protein
MSQYLNDVVYGEYRTIRVQGIKYILYVPTIPEMFSEMKIRAVYDTMETKHKDVYNEFHKIKRDTITDQVAGLVKAMRKINGEENWKEDEYIWFYDDHARRHYAVAPEREQRNYSGIEVRPIHYEDTNETPLWQLLMDDDEPDYYSDDEARAAGEAEDKKLAEYDAKEREKDKREEAMIAKIDAAAAKNAPEAKKARQLVRKQNEEDRVVSRQALAQYFKDEKAEAKRAAKVVSDAKKAAEKEAEKAKKAEEKAKKAEEKEAEKAEEKAKKAEEKEAEKVKKAEEKAATKKNKTMKKDVNTILGGIRNKRSTTKSRTQKRGKNSK